MEEQRAAIQAVWRTVPAGSEESNLPEAVLYVQMGEKGAVRFEQVWKCRTFFLELIISIGVDLEGSGRFTQFGRVEPHETILETRINNGQGL